MEGVRGGDYDYYVLTHKIRGKGARNNSSQVGGEAELVINKKRILQTQTKVWAFELLDTLNRADC